MAAARPRFSSIWHVTRDTVHKDGYNSSCQSSRHIPFFFYANKSIYIFCILPTGWLVASRSQGKYRQTTIQHIHEYWSFSYWFALYTPENFEKSNYAKILLVVFQSKSKCLQLIYLDYTVYFLFFLSGKKKVLINLLSIRISPDGVQHEWRTLKCFNSAWLNQNRVPIQIGY